MKKMRKIIAMVLSVVMVMLAMSVGDFANDNVLSQDIPSDLPVGTVKIAEGIYAYTPDDNAVEPLNSMDWLNIGDVPGMGTIVQPSGLNNIIVNNGHNYLMLGISESVRINLVRGTQSVFGADYNQWPKMGGSKTTRYYIEADYYNIAKGVPYSMQLTSSNSLTRWEVEVRYFTDPQISDFID